MVSRTRSGPITKLPAGWSIEVLDQGEHINEVWLVVSQHGTRCATYVSPRDGIKGLVLLDLALAT